MIHTFIMLRSIRAHLYARVAIAEALARELSEPSARVLRMSRLRDLAHIKLIDDQIKRLHREYKMQKNWFKTCDRPIWSARWQYGNGQREAYRDVMMYVEAESIDLAARAVLGTENVESKIFHHRGGSTMRFPKGYTLCRR